MLIVIAIITILMTAGSIGISNAGGKGVSSGVASAEALFDEAHATAVGKNIRSAVLIAKDLEYVPGDNLKKIIVAHEEIDSSTGAASNPDGDPVWVPSSRGTTLGSQVYFSVEYSKKDHSSGTGEIETYELDLGSSKKSVNGIYYVYEFNGEGVPKNPGASFVIGFGAMRPNEEQPIVTASAKRDFGGFVVWRNGRTSVFRSPEQIASEINSLTPGTKF